MDALKPICAMETHIALQNTTKAVSVKRESMSVKDKAALNQFAIDGAADQ